MEPGSEPVPFDPDIAERHGLRGTLIGLGMAALYAAGVHLADGLIAGLLDEVLGPRRGHAVHLGLFGLVLVGFAAQGVWRMRDRFAWVAAAVFVGVPLGAYILAALRPG